ncbi:uncharacterized protein LOC116177912 [Photinus pyralis]|uniref:uncharacterized protein LOC116177912 n=1 Tax=Photinus pyralis TaxID=7054 RepID=UPI0012672ED5|nr:uncharacterized protein LOC116177912 [Photinus pyralis]
MPGFSKSVFSAQLTSSLHGKSRRDVEVLISRCQRLSKKILTTTEYSPKNELFAHFLLDAQLWTLKDFCIDNQLEDLGVYGTLDNGKTAEYIGTSSDDCLIELLINLLLHGACKVSMVCSEFMFGNRMDVGYVLTHSGVHNL